MMGAHVDPADVAEIAALRLAALAREDEATGGVAASPVQGMVAAVLALGHRMAEQNIWAANILGNGSQGSPMVNYTHVQIAPLAIWVIPHNLNSHPVVVTVDSAGAVVEGDVLYDSANTIIVAFSAPFSGTAYLR